MFIRWQSRERNRPARHSYDGHDVHHKAVLVEAVRVNGKPRQKHIACLCGFTESALKIPTQQCLVWIRIEKRLRQLGNRISPADLKRSFPQLYTAMTDAFARCGNAELGPRIRRLLRLSPTFPGGAMQSQLSRLPERFPVGTRYVVEASGRVRGHLRIQSRYVEFPDGRHVDLPRTADRPFHARVTRGRRGGKK
jgi:hypothetical protein